MSNLAKKRWRLLSEILIDKKINCRSELAEISVRRFSSFQLFQLERCTAMVSCTSHELLTFNGSNTEIHDSKCYRSCNATNGSEKSTEIIEEQTVAVCHNVSKECSNLESVISNFSSSEQIILQPNEVDVNGKDDHIWFTYKSKFFPTLLVDIRHLCNSLSLNNLQGFNNTGNVCVWPSEEVLAYYCLKHAEQFRMKAVCELGGGMTCLAIMMLSSYIELQSAMATDGNEQSVTNLEEIVVHNRDSFLAEKVSARLLRWDDEKTLLELGGLFDYIICADCLFFDEFRQPLLQALVYLLKPQGRAIIFAPSRGGSFDRFVELIEKCDRVRLARVCDNYDPVIHNLHLQNLSAGKEFYDESLHYPKLIELIKL